MFRNKRKKKLRIQYWIDLRKQNWEGCMRGKSHIQEIEEVLERIEIFVSAEEACARVNDMFTLFIKPNIFVRVWRYIISKLKRK